LLFYLFEKNTTAMTYEFLEYTDTTPYEQIVLSDKAPYNRPFQLEYTFYPDSQLLFLHVRANTLEEYTEMLFDSIVETEQSTIANDPDYESSLSVLGPTEFKEELQQVYCTPLVGKWTDVYITLKVSKDSPKFAHVKYAKSPTIVELLYTYSKLWQDYHEQAGHDISNDWTHCIMLKVSGSHNSNLLTVCVGLNS